jgi:hypothetical protein
MMPVHDWTRVDAAIFHGFTHGWITEISRAINRGMVSDSYYAIPEMPMHSEANRYAAKAKGVVVRHVSRHQVVAIVEIVSPGNKGNQQGLGAFVRKAQGALAAGVHLLIIDLFPPTARDPVGIHPAIWGEDGEAEYVHPADKPLTCVSYVGGAGAAAFLEPVSVGDPLPEMPLFLTPEIYVPTPLEPTYEAAWEGMPAYWRDVLTGSRDLGAGA